MSKGVQDAGRKADAALAKVGDSAKQAGQHLEAAGKSGESVGGRVSGALSGAASDAAEGLTGKLGQLGGVLGGLGPVGMAVGATLGAALAGVTAVAGKLKEALDASVERAKSAALAGAQLGLTSPEQVKQIAKVAGKVYGDNFGASVDDATKAVRDVLRNNLVDEDAGDDLVKGVSEKLLTLATIAEDNTAHISQSVSQMLRTGMAKSADEAIDVLTRGFQEGGDKAEDLLDTLNEYPTQFRKLGLDAQAATGLLVQGLRAGARDSDIVADALKEFSIRAVDGSKLTAQGFKDLGLNGEKMAAQIARGGADAAAGLDTVLDRLRNVKDPVKQAQIAVALFGTQAEDLGAALFALDPSEAVKRLGDVAGATDRAGDAMARAVPWTETLSRRWAELKADVGDKLRPVFDAVGEALDRFGQKVLPEVNENLDRLKQMWNDNRDGIEKFLVFLKDMAPYIEAAVVVAINVLAGSIGFLIAAMAEWGRTWERLKEVSRRVTDAILDTFGEVIHGAAEAFSWVPGVGPKLAEAAKSFDRFRDRVNAALDGIQDEQVNVNVRVTGLSGLGDTIARAVGANMVSSGLRARASGGVAGGLTRVAERGGEILDLPQGTMVYAAGNTNQMMAQAPASTAPVVVNVYGSVIHERELLDLISGHVKAAGGRPELLGLKG